MSIPLVWVCNNNTPFLQWNVGTEPYSQQDTDIQEMLWATSERRKDRQTNILNERDRMSKKGTEKQIKWNSKDREKNKRAKRRRKWHVFENIPELP